MMCLFSHVLGTSLFCWVRYDRNEKRTRRSMMSFLVIASTENYSRIASSFLDGSRRRGRTFRKKVNDLWVAVALENVPLCLTCWACQKTETDAHHILVLQHALRFRSSISFVKKYFFGVVFSRNICSSFVTKNPHTTAHELPVFVRAP